jgi:hypothetical protein
MASIQFAFDKLIEWCSLFECAGRLEVTPAALRDLEVRVNFRLIVAHFPLSRLRDGWACFTSRPTVPSVLFGAGNVDR